MWHAQLILNDSVTLTFNFEAETNGITILNSRERIRVTEIRLSADSIFFRMPVYDSEIRCRLDGDTLTGYFLNHARTSNNRIPFKAIPGRFEPFVNAFDLKMFEGKWEVAFSGDEPPMNKAIGEFRQTGNHVTGTFLTPTGDYRYLEGYADGNRMVLSRFDGSHIFYFDAIMNDDGTLAGNYYSGKHWHDKWTAFRNDSAALPDAHALTYLKHGYKRLDFSFPDMDSNLVSLSDPEFSGKVIIVQIMGTWCPNCLDELAFLVPFYNEHRKDGLEIIALDYEKIPTFPTAKRNIMRLKERFEVPYTILFAGTSDRALRGNSLPMLNAIIGFPTTILVDRKGNVRDIHTGFSGPATGMYYERWKEEFSKKVQVLLDE